MLVQAFAPGSILDTLILVYWDFGLGCANILDPCCAEGFCVLYLASSFCHSCITTQQIVANLSATIDVTRTVHNQERHQYRGCLGQINENNQAVHALTNCYYLTLWPAQHGDGQAQPCMQGHVRASEINMEIMMVSLAVSVGMQSSQPPCRWFESCSSKTWHWLGQPCCYCSGSSIV